MNYYIFIRPLIGAGIGYITNWIAVKMLFRPLKPIKIGNFKIPFTPGIIPKNKERLAESIGDTISNDLLGQDDLKKALLSNDIKDKIKNNIELFTISLQNNDSTIEDLLNSYIGLDNYEPIIEKIKGSLTSSIHKTIIEANLGNIVAEQIEITAKEKLKGSVLGILGGNSIVSSITSNISVKLNQYIKNEGQALISQMVEKEINTYTSKQIKTIFSNINNSTLTSIIINIYEEIILNKISNFLEIIDISKIIKDKINSMDVLELEKLILIIMKKELNALVNLGAIIGFLLGLLNLLF